MTKDSQIAHCSSEMDINVTRYKRNAGNMNRNKLKNEVTDTNGI